MAPPNSNPHHDLSPNSQNHLQQLAEQADGVSVSISTVDAAMMEKMNNAKMAAGTTGTYAIKATSSPAAAKEDDDATNNDDDDDDDQILVASPIVSRRTDAAAVVVGAPLPGGYCSNEMAMMEDPSASEYYDEDGDDDPTGSGFDFAFHEPNQGFSSILSRWKTQDTENCDVPAAIALQATSGPDGNNSNTVQAPPPSPRRQAPPSTGLRAGSGKKPMPPTTPSRLNRPNLLTSYTAPSPQQAAAAAGRVASAVPEQRKTAASSLSSPQYHIDMSKPTPPPPPPQTSPNSAGGGALQRKRPTVRPVFKRRGSAGSSSGLLPEQQQVPPPTTPKKSPPSLGKQQTMMTKGGTPRTKIDEKRAIKPSLLLSKRQEAAISASEETLPTTNVKQVAGGSREQDGSERSANSGDERQELQHQMKQNHSMYSNDVDDGSNSGNSFDSAKEEIPRTSLRTRFQRGNSVELLGAGGPNGTNGTNNRFVKRQPKNIYQQPLVECSSHHDTTETADSSSLKSTGSGGSGSEGSSSGSDGTGAADPDQSPQPRTIKLKKKKKAKTYEPVVYERTNYERKLIRKCMKQNVIFSELTSDDMNVLVTAFELCKYEKGDTIGRQGEPGTQFYIVSHGKIEFVANGKLVSVARRGAAFGELSLLYTCPRVATVTAARDGTEILCIHQRAYRHLLQQQQEHVAEKERQQLAADGVDQSGTSNAELALNEVPPPAEQAAPVPAQPTRSSRPSAGGPKQAGAFKADAVIDEVPPPAEQAAPVPSQPTRAPRSPRAPKPTPYTPPRAKAKKKPSAGFNMPGKSPPQQQPKWQQRKQPVTPQSPPQKSPQQQQTPKVKREVKVDAKKPVIIGSTPLPSEQKPHPQKVEEKEKKQEEIKQQQQPKPQQVQPPEEVVAKPGETVEEQLPEEGKSALPTLEQLQKHMLLGEGTFGQAWLVSAPPTAGSKKKTYDKRVYVLKVQVKHELAAEGQITSATREKQIMLQANDHPFLISLKTTYQDKSCVYMLLDFLQGGELFSVLHEDPEDCGLPESQAKFYALGIADALVYLHKKQIVYRDLKPENIMIDRLGYAVLIDLGCAKQLADKHAKTYTMCGTPGYLPPEVVTTRGHNCTADFWSLGILIYELLAGENPFYYEGMDQMTLFEAIIKGEYAIPDGASDEAQDILAKLLVKDPTARLGSLIGARNIFGQPWFRPLDIKEMRNRSIKAPWTPEISNPLDCQNFEDWSHLEDKTAQQWPKLPKKYAARFEGF